jgi:hypothetical protein
MTRRSKTRLTFKKIRLALFLRSYAFYRISKELREKYPNKRVIPEISRISRVLNLPHKPLRKAIALKKFHALSKKVQDKENIGIYLAIESEVTLLARAKGNKSDFKDSDYDEDFALLNLAIERTAGNNLKDVEDDLVFKRQSEELKRKYHYWYYKTAYKYKLPTIRIVPFILRLVS